MRWHLYCRVVDNFGDIGVAWRLAADLAARGEAVRLGVDDASALAWLAPAGAEGVEVRDWSQPASDTADVVVELFGAGLPEHAIDSLTRAAHPPIVVNVEHLSAEPYVERSHGLPSPRRSAAGLPYTVWFFYPGFVERSGGLLREPALLAHREEFLADEWLAARDIETQRDERRVSLFCYDHAAVAPLLEALGGEPTLLLLTRGTAGDGVANALGPSMTRGALRAVRLPFLDQADFDRLLWSCDLNIVRGEDSLVRAIWAGVPFVWQIYPQADGAHVAKLDAFLDRFLNGAPPRLATAVRALFQRCNGIDAGASEPQALADAGPSGWSVHCARWRAELAARDDLAARLIRFVASKR